MTIANLHLASNRFAPNGRGEGIRLEELDAFFGAVPDADVVVGDFNATPESGVYARMVERGYEDAGRHCVEHGRLPHQRVDYIWLRAEAAVTAEAFGVVTGQALEVDCEEGVLLSDHHPLWAELRRDLIQTRRART